MTVSASHTAPDSVRARVVDYLTSQYLGPADGAYEAVTDRPDRVYLVGTLYPRGPAAERMDGDVVGDDPAGEDLDDQVELTNAWHPASAAVSFLHDGTALDCTVAAGAYERDVTTGRWHRTPLDGTVRLVPPGAGAPSAQIFGGRGRVSSVWRPVANNWLVTVALENQRTHDDPTSEPPSQDCLYQVRLNCRTVDGQVLPYPTSQDLSDDPEEEELRLVYRHTRIYGAGHGCSVDWAGDADETVREVRTQMLPTTVVPAVRARSERLPILQLARLGDPDVPTDVLCGELTLFVDAYEHWIDQRHAETDEFTGTDLQAGRRLVERMRTAASRMRTGIDLLRGDTTALDAFRLANLAMREQMLQTQHLRDSPGKRGTALITRDTTPAKEPTWRLFQLGFQLLTLASTADPDHDDRDLVDLIWFPTGGGKTEAYLALAAFEMIRRRLTRGTRGGGTAVLTRYTLRLLTTQQFQRSASLICALELLRRDHPRLRSTPPFSIGLWVGSETSPNDFVSAHKEVLRVRKSLDPDSPFQVQTCPWCGTALFPSRRTNDADAYGVRTTANSFELFCPHRDCAFHDQLPIAVVDQQIYNDPPTLVVGTVDKLARLPWVADAGSVFGSGTSPFDPPSLIVQDELHLLSGPLGTTVAVYEAGVQSLLGWHGARPKIVASTATIRAAEHQVRGLYAAPVALFPPSGLDTDDSFFAVVDKEAPGRMYVGVMPQGHTQSYSTVLAATALLQAPRRLELSGADLDDYWTVVAYHNSLRELGRTVTIARDDVDSMLRAERHGPHTRELRRDGIVELTSNVSAAQLPAVLARLERRVDQDDAVDLVATTNMLSVGIDISRLGLMLMNGQPKTTSEYIQATSRVGRAEVPGLVVTLLRSAKPRDRSHYESFRAYHEALYRYVEPTSVTPWSLASRNRSLPATLALLVRHATGLRANDDAGRFTSHDQSVRRAVDTLRAWVARSDPDEAADTSADLDRLVGDWDERAEMASRSGTTLRYRSTNKDDPALLRDFGETKAGWDAMSSMRSVDRQVRVLAIGERV